MADFITAALVDPTRFVIASGGGEQAANPIVGLLPFLLIGLVFYALIIRPQKKRQSEKESMLRALSVGDEVVSIGGIHGEIVGMTDDIVELLVADGIVLTMARNAISQPSGPPVADVLDDDDLLFDDDDEHFDDDDATAIDMDDVQLDDADDRSDDR